MQNKSKIMIVIGVVLAGLLAGYIFVYRDDAASDDRILVPGVVEATVVRLSFRAGGSIEEVFVKEGEFISKGKILAVLDREEFLNEKEKAKAALQESILNHRRLQEDYARTEKLYEAGAVPKQQLDEIKTEFGAAGARMEMLEAALRLADLRLSYADLRSPLDGFILVASAEAGEFVHPGSTVLSIMDLRNTWVTGYISVKDLGRIKLNQEAYIVIDAYPERKFPGRISFISQEAEFTPKHVHTPEERTKLVYRIKIDVDNPDMVLKPGMPADGYIDIPDGYHDKNR